MGLFRSTPQEKAALAKYRKARRDLESCSRDDKARFERLNRAVIQAERDVPWRKR